MKNLALKLLAEKNLCVGDVECVELAGELADTHGGRLCWIKRVDGPGLGHYAFDEQEIWDYHAVAIIDGLVHDPWGPGPMPLYEWSGEAFPRQQLSFEYPAEEDNER